MRLKISCESFASVRAGQSVLENLQVWLHSQEVLQKVEESGRLSSRALQEFWEKSEAMVSGVVRSL
jgi:hypothetical protein